MNQNSTTNQASASNGNPILRRRNLPQLPAIDISEHFQVQHTGQTPNAPPPGHVPFPFMVANAQQAPFAAELSRSSESLGSRGRSR
ncbi:hypothetical protein [Cupriavidus necator]